jgi:hypothetical protein
MPLFKTPEDRVQAGQDKLLRGDYAGARDEFASAADGFGKKGRAFDAQVAQTYALLLGLQGPGATADGFKQLATALVPLGTTPLKLGTRTVPAADVGREASLLSEELGVLASRPSTPEAHADAGRRLQALALSYRQLGNQVLIIPELFRLGSLTAQHRALLVSALAEEEMGEAEVTRNPKRAAEHNQNARNWWLQAGEGAKADLAAQRVSRYGRAVKCWFCGREAAGDGINFQTLASDVRGFGVGGDPSALPDSNEGQGVVYACRPCSSALDRLADAKAQARTKELEDRINRMLQQMKSQSGINQAWVPAQVPP